MTLVLSGYLTSGIKFHSKWSEFICFVEDRYLSSGQPCLQVSGTHNLHLKSELLGCVGCGVSQISPLLGLKVVCNICSHGNLLYVYNLHQGTFPVVLASAPCHPKDFVFDDAGVWVGERSWFHSLT